MFKTETHLHTAETSPCGKIPAAEMVKLYHDAGYKTIFVSDHFEERILDMSGETTWKNKIKNFLSGYYAAKKAGEALGMNILMSAELKREGSHNHYLLYGITEEFLINNPDIFALPIKKFNELAKENGIFIVQAHPHRDDQCTPTPEIVDGLEVHNSNPRHTDYSEKGEECAKKHGLYMSAGSDAHQLADIAGSGVMSENEIKTAKDFIELLKSGKATLIRK